MRLFHERQAEVPGQSAKALQRHMADVIGVAPDKMRSCIKAQSATEVSGAPMTTVFSSARSCASSGERMRSLRRANSILKAASAFFAVEIDRYTHHSGVLCGPQGPRGCPWAALVRRTDLATVPFCLLTSVSRKMTLTRGLLVLWWTPIGALSQCVIHLIDFHPILVACLKQARNTRATTVASLRGSARIKHASTIWIA